MLSIISIVPYLNQKNLGNTLMARIHWSKYINSVFTQLIAGLKSWKFQRLMILLGVDTILIASSYWFSFILRFDDINFIFYKKSFTDPLFAAVLSYLISFYFGGAYRQLWRYANFENILLLAKVTFLGTIVFVSCKYLMFPKIVMPRSIVIIHMLLCFILTSAARLSWRVVISKLNSKSNLLEKQKCVIYGAGSAGEMLARFIHQSPRFSYHVIGFVDDNLNKKNHKLHSYKILGTGKDLAKLSSRYGVDVVIIAVPSLSGKIVRKIISNCEQANLRVLVMPDIESSLGKNIFSLRNINEKDLLRRVPKPTDYKLLEPIFKDKSIMVTGGGGSIGSEICLQIVRMHPKKIIIYDVSEYNLYSIDQKLRKMCHNHVELILVLGSVTDRPLVRRTINKNHPSIILHAAAYKHVPIVEMNPVEGIKNNIGGTCIVASEAINGGVEKFILISTDKAVNSTNIMGHTKRCCELVVQAYQKHQKGRCQFSSVRFGNVLGSSGSVIPLFLEQIKKGGPVTVTDKEVTRYFMLVEEAVGLVLQTLLKSKGGEIFVLDMGDPVKIFEMAKQLIHLNGKRPFYDIDIEFTGLRAGEKMYEELIIEGAEKTTLHSHIYIAKPSEISSERLLKDIEDLIGLTEENDRVRVVDKLLEITTTKKIKQKFIKTSVPFQETINVIQ